VEAVLRTALPVVLDAGALTVLAERADLRDLLRTRPAPSVLTPHEGEFLRLGGRLGQDRIASARDLSARMHAVVLLKGPGTIICAPDGTCLIDRAGTPALATAGSGDVLTGCIASLLAAAAARRSVSSDPTAARVAAAGCWLHGMAGRLAQEAGSVTASMIAGALVRVQGPYREQSEHGAS
jgi:ADP-dependent NAD(P)H-hydrate dehydratase / NAD(P)H-hydrate epimerase